MWLLVTELDSAEHRIEHFHHHRRFYQPAVPLLGLYPRETFTYVFQEKPQESL